MSHKATFEIKQSLKGINKGNVTVYPSVPEDPVTERTVIRNNSPLATAPAHSHRQGAGGRKRTGILPQETIKVVCGKMKGFAFDK